jgi:hypothetical protein
MLNESISGPAIVDLPANDPLLAAHKMPFLGVFYPMGFAVEISTNDPAVLEAAAQGWGHTQPRHVSATIQIRVGVSGPGTPARLAAPTVRAQRHLITFIADHNNHATCDLTAGFGYAWMTQSTIADRLYFRYHFLDAMILLLISGVHAPALHAACVSSHGRGMLLAGASGAGKSTLAYACARAGFTYITDDASYLLHKEDPPRVAGSSHLIRFRPSSRDLFPELCSRELTPRLEGKPSIEIRTAELPGLITAQQARVDYIILLRRDERSAASLSEVPTHVALQSFHPHLYPVEEIRRLQVAALEKLKNVMAFEFHYSRLDDAVRCLAALARQPGEAR